MCNFVSAICYRSSCWADHPQFDDLQIYCDPEHTDSHSDLRETRQVHNAEHEELRATRWTGIEFRPPADVPVSEWGNLSRWTLAVDEAETAPEWWEASHDEIRSRLERRVEAMFVREPRGTILGGCWIILPGGSLRRLVHGRIAAISGEANLSRADLSGSNLSWANLSGANLSGANLSGANLSGADLSGANLSRANLSRANLSRANLRGDDLSGSDLSRADLSGADLSGADLSGSDLSGAYLRSTDLSVSDLSGAYLSGANLSGANLRGAYRPSGNLPSGWVRDRNGYLRRDES
jgi:hypothetical protein